MEGGRRNEDVGGEARAVGHVGDLLLGVVGNTGGIGGLPESVIGICLQFGGSAVVRQCGLVGRGARSW